MKQLLFFFVLAYCFYSHAQTDSLCLKTKASVKELVRSINRWNQTAIGMDYNVTCKKIDSILSENDSCFKQYELSQLYLDLAENIAKATDTIEEKVPFYFKKAILSGYSAAEILNLRTGLYVKINFPEQYKELEHLSDSMYVVSCNKFKNANINLQLGFLLRYMTRKDQDVRTREMIARSATQKKDTVLEKFVDEMNEVDSINEILLIEIFERYGYPGWHLVGSESGSALLLMFHMSPKFKLKYIHLAELSRVKQEVFFDDSVFHGLIDRTLMQNFKVSLYGSYNSLKEKDKKVINKYRGLLQLPEEK